MRAGTVANKNVYKMKRNIKKIVDNAEMSEKAVEKYLMCEVRKLGGICLKFASMSMTGYPDRLVLLPGGRQAWVELKSHSEQPREIQRVRHAELMRLGQKVYVVDDRSKVGALVDLWRNGL